jgi:hypothetical protein
MSSASRNRPSQSFGKMAKKDTDHSTSARDGAGSGPGNRSRAPVLSGTPVGADHRNDGGAEPERQRDQDVFKTGSERVADRGFLARLARNAGEQDHRKVGNHHVDQAGHADLEAVGKGGQRGVTPRKVSVTSDRRERR